jgi:hypothetical protein
VGAAAALKSRFAVRYNRDVVPAHIPAAVDRGQQQEVHMNRFLVTIVLFVTLACTASAALGKQLVREFNGSESTTTADFEVRAPWIVDWRVTGDYPGQMALNVNLLSAPTGEYQGRIVTTKYVDDGVKLFMEESGVFRFQVNSTLIRGWSLKVEELTRQEAEQYKQKEPYEKQKR